MKAQRDAFGEALLELGANAHELVVLDADNATATRTTAFANRFPERFINVGVAEQNLVGVAAGLALAGLRPLACTFAIFLVGRGFEAIRNTIALNNLSVVLVGTHAGISVGRDGSTHFAVEDIALMRALPNMSVVVPADEYQVMALLPQLYERKGPSYLRISRSGTPPVSGPETKIEFGKGVLLRRGADCALVAAGLMVHQALAASDLLATEGLSCAVACLHTIKPVDVEFLRHLVQDVGAIVVAEEHSIYGGVYGAVCEALAGLPRRPPCIPVGLADTFAEGGDEGSLFAKYGLTAAAIAVAARRAIGNHSPQRP